MFRLMRICSRPSLTMELVNKMALAKNNTTGKMNTKMAKVQSTEAVAQAFFYKRV